MSSHNSFNDRAFIKDEKALLKVAELFPAQQRHIWERQCKATVEFLAAAVIVVFATYSIMDGGIVQQSWMAVRGEVR